MRKKQIYLILAFLLTNLISGQKVTLKPTVVNGVSVSNGPINLASVPYSTILLVADIEIPANVSVGDQGTITIYFSKATGIGSNVSIGGNGGSLYFGGGKKVSRNFTINLNWTDFSTSGGYIYCEYKNNGVSFKSPNISVIKNPTVNTGTILNPPADAPNPNTIVNTLCCDQTIRLGEKPAPIIGSQYLNPYQNEPYGINSTWNIGNIGTNNTDLTNNILTFDYVNELKNITVTRSLGYRYKLEFPNKSNTVTITVVPSPITYNEIRVNGSVNTDGSIEISSTNPKDILGDRSSINLNALQNPYYTPKRGDTNIFIDKYEWEYSIINGTTEEQSWNMIPNQFSSSLNSLLLPRSNSSKDNLYSVRRIAIYQNLKVASNSLKIWVRGLRDDNTICCDQTLEVSSSNVVETPATITGPIAISNKNTYLFYQWQSQTVTESGSKFSNWTNIPQATSKDYNPPTPQFIPGSGRNQPTVPTYNYRRIATDNVYKGETYYSNEISLTPSTNVIPSPFIIYPNPASNVITIERPGASYLGAPDLSTADIKIVNITGNIINLNYIAISPNLVSINITDINPGMYFLNILYKSSGNRLYSEQLTFIKQ